MTVHLDPIAEVLHLKDLLGQANALARIRAERIAEKDEALRVALEALETCGEYEDSDGNWHASFSDSQVEAAIAEIKKAL